MSRRPRRSGINFIENERDRNLTYFKRRSGLYKSIADLSTLSGAKVAFVVEAESGKRSAFGTPCADPIINAFLSHTAPPDMSVDEGEMARITYMQDELFRLEKDKTAEEKRAKETKDHLKEILKTSSLAKFLSDDDLEKLGVGELHNFFQRLALVQEDISNQAKGHNNQLEVSNYGDPSLTLSSSSWPSQIKIPPRRLPWVPLHSSQHGQSPWAHVSHGSLLKQVIPSLEQPPLHHHQEHMLMPPPPPPPTSNEESHQFNCYLPPPLPQQVDLDQNLSYAHNFGISSPLPPHEADELADSLFLVADDDGQPSDSFQWPPLSPYSEPYFGAALNALNASLDLVDNNGGHDVVHDPSDGLLLQKAYDEWLAISPLESPGPGENYGDGATSYLW